MQHGHAEWICSIDMQHGQGAWTQHGHAAWRHGHTALTWTCSTDMNLQHGNWHAAWTSSMDIKHVVAAWTCIMYIQLILYMQYNMQHGPAACKCSVGPTWSMETELTCSITLTWACNMDMDLQHGHGHAIRALTWVCSITKHAAQTWACCTDMGM